VGSSLRVQRQIRREIGTFVSTEFLRTLYRGSALRTAGTLAHIWLAIALGFWAAGAVLSLPAPAALPLGLLLALFMATRINALNVLVHEGSHGALAASRKLNERLTNWAAGYWILFDADGYRRVHMRHHQHLNEPEDPDRPLYELSPGRAALLHGFLRDLLWVSLFRRIWVYVQGGGEGPRLGGLRHLAGKGIANGLLVGGALWLHGFPTGLLVYGAFWVFPLFSLYPMIIRLRLLAEHFDPAIMDDHLQENLFVSRTSQYSWLEHYLFGAQMEYHFEHHLFPGIPYANARRLHDALRERGFFEKSRHVVRSRALSGGYFRFLRTLLASDWVAGSARPAVADTR